MDIITWSIVNVIDERNNFDNVKLSDLLIEYLKNVVKLVVVLIEKSVDVTNFQNVQLTWQCYCEAINLYWNRIKVEEKNQTFNIIVTKELQRIPLEVYDIVSISDKIVVQQWKSQSERISDFCTKYSVKVIPLVIQELIILFQSNV